MPDREDTVIASPLPFLLAEEGHGDRQAREALFCAANADLGYFEQEVLGVAQSAGARVTVIADGRISDPDPRAARNAGTRYVHGLAVAGPGAAFHAKVAVIAGPERAMVAIGSGNLSAAGWHLNRELWTVATADRERCPSIVTEVAGWLRTLDQVCAITPQAMQAAERSAALLEQLAGTAAVADTGQHLAHSSFTPLIDQLPAGEVSRLLLYAPFHDEKAAALRRLIERLRPARVTLAVQSGGRTVIQPDAVRQVVADLGVPFDVIEDAGAGYRHGKLIEATDPAGGRWTLTGSPDLSARALLLPAADGGNIETAVISRPDSSLFPGGRPVALEQVPAVRITAPADGRDRDVVLLAAVRTGSGLEVVFSREIAHAARLLAADTAGADRWMQAGTVPARAASHVLAGVDLAGGTPVRCAWGLSPASSLGGIVFVTDPALVLNRAGEISGRDPGGPAGLMTDPLLLQRWTHALGALANAPRTAGEDWLAYTDNAKAELGAGMFHFAMGGFSALRDPAGLLEPADRPIEDNRPGFDSDDAAVVGDDTDPGVPATPAEAADDGGDSGVVSARNLTEAERRRVRRELEAAADTIMPRLPAVHRLAILSLLLYATQAELWDGPLGDQGWFPVVARALENLDRDDIPERMSGNAASWAATATYLMHEHRPTTGRPAEILVYEKATASVSHLFPDADPQVIARLTEPFTNKNGYPIDADAVMYLIGMVVQADPLAEAIDILEANHPAWQVHKHSDRLLHVQGEFRGTFLPAAEALDAMPDNGTAAVWATGFTQGWTIVIREEGTLIQIDKNPQGLVTWRHYRLGSLTSPTGIARDPELGNRARIKHGPLNQPFPEAIAAIVAAGIDPTADSPSECPE